MPRDDRPPFDGDRIDWPDIRPPHDGDRDWPNDRPPHDADRDWPDDGREPYDGDDPDPEPRRRYPRDPRDDHSDTPVTEPELLEAEHRGWPGGPEE
jgi:hypothetical protein